MSMFQKILCILVVPMLATIIGVAQSAEKAPDPSTEEMIAGLEKEYIKGLIDKDEKVLDRLISDSYTAWDSKGELLPTTKADILASKNENIHTYETWGVEILLKDNIATVMGNLKSERWRASTGGYILEGKFERTWKFRNGSWSVTGYKSSLRTTSKSGNLLASDVAVTAVKGSETPTTFSTKIVLRIWGRNLNARGLRFAINGKDITDFVIERSFSLVVVEAKNTGILNIFAKEAENQLSFSINGVSRNAFSFREHSCGAFRLCQYF